MDNWRYLRVGRRVVDISSLETSDKLRVIAEHVHPDHGPLLAVAPRMLAWMNEFRTKRLTEHDRARLHDEAIAIFREIDGAK